MIILDIIVIHIVFRCIVHKDCIILNFYISCHIKEKWVEFFFFIIFFFFALFSEKWKYKKTWFLYVTSNKGFLEFSTIKITKQNKKYVWKLWSSWIVICLSWRYSYKKPCVTMFLSVSYDYIFEYCSSLSSFVINLMMYAFPTRFMVCMMHAF